jgi:WD40 repeat protein
MTTFYKFRYTNLNHRCSLHHFQLRYLLSAPSKNDVYYIHENSLRRWDTCTRTSELIINLKESRQIAWKGWMPSTLACTPQFAAVGGYSGEYAIIPLETQYECIARVGSLAPPAYITNHVDVSYPIDSPVRLIWSNNDSKIRQQDVETGTVLRIHELPWPVNATATSPDGRMRAVVGDTKQVVLMDAARGDVIKELWGHNHWSFTVDWRNDGYTFVTGNQDMTAKYPLVHAARLTCRIWDARKMSDAVVTLPATMGAVRSVHFSSDGNFLSVAEPADYVHVYDASTGLYEDKQTVEFIGEIAGVSFDPSGERLFIGNGDDLVGSIYEFGRCRGKEREMDWEGILL